jgi:hypothetical protein
MILCLFNVKNTYILLLFTFIINIHMIIYNYDFLDLFYYIHFIIYVL